MFTLLCFSPCILPDKATVDSSHDSLTLLDSRPVVGYVPAFTCGWATGCCSFADAGSTNT